MYPYNEREAMEKAGEKLGVNPDDVMADIQDNYHVDGLA